MPSYVLQFWSFCALLWWFNASAAEPDTNTLRGVRTITHYSLTSANDFPGRDPRDWRLLGSTNGGAQWVVLDERTNQIFTERFETKSFRPEVQVPCSLFRLEVMHVRDPRNVNSIQLAEFELRGPHEGKELADLRPRRSDLLSVQGEYPPGETRRMLFDGDFQTKWLDFSLNDKGERGTWIQWEYDTANEADPDPVQPFTRVADLNIKARTWTREPFFLQLKATVLWVSENGNSVVLNDISGAALVRLPLALTNVSRGTIVNLSGNAFLVRRGGAVEIQSVPLINNDGIHEDITRSGSVFLRAGKHPITVEWFNRLGHEAFKVEYEGPGILRQIIPNHALSIGTANSESDLGGITYRYYEGAWDMLPVFSQMNPLKEGVVTNFTILDGPKRENRGMVFSGALKVPRDGEYTFYLSSDDGSRLFLGSRDLRITTDGTGALPAPLRMPAGVAIGLRDEFQWSAGEGEITYIGEGKNGWEMVLQSRSGAMTVLLGESEPIPHYLLGSRVRIHGICIPTLAPDDHLVAGELVAPSLQQIRVSTVAPRYWRQVPVSKLAQLAPTDSGRPIRLRGQLIATNEMLILADEGLSIRVDAGSRPPRPGSTRTAEALGQFFWNGSEPVLRLAEWREIGDTPAENRPLPILRNIEQVHGLRPQEAQRGYPVLVRGVVTCAWPDSEDAVIQDGTRGIFVAGLTAGFDDWPEVGDYFEVEGRTDPGGFAPIIIAGRVSRFGKGAMPDPIRPTWAQLLNGSVDAQYVEIRGVVSSVEGEYISLLMRGGRLRLQMETMTEEKLRQYENSIVRLRGCLAASWNGETRKVIPGELRMNSASISVERDAPSDLFAVPSKRAGDLLLFDANADDLQRIKVSGQFLGSRMGVYFLLDGETGVRFVPKRPIALAAGEFVQVVGFPRAEGPAVVLRDATARRVPRPENGKTNSADAISLPPAKLLTGFDLLRPENDATRVSVQARLLGVRTDGAEEIMELQQGHRTFVAYLLNGNGSATRFPVGSLVQVAGILVGRGSTDQRRVDAFDLLVSSTADVKLLERPSWWTLEHSAATAGGTILVLLAAGAWIRSLRREVARKTLNLRREIDERKNAEEVAHRARRQAEAAAEDAQAGSRAKSQFLATMSHEIRTPMNGILGMNNLLLDSGLTREQRDLAETVSASGEALLSLLNDILDFSKIEAGKLSLDHSEFCLRETVEGAIDLIAARAQTKSLEVNYWIEENVPARFRGDSGRFRQVLLNLLSNSVKFTEHGEIFVEVSGEARDGNTVLKVMVRDSGIGIAPEMQDRVFLAFEQADQSTTRKYGGSGLGLAICKRLVELMGGNIGLESAVGVGTTFWFTLTLEHLAPSADPSHEHDPLAGVPVLIVEKHPTTARVLRDLAAGWRMPNQTTASFDGIPAWINSQSESAIGLVMVDAASAAGNEKLNILEAVQQLRANFPQKKIRFGLVTSLQGRPAARDLNRAEVHTCLTKPVRRNQFRNALLQLIKEPHQRPAIKETSNTEQLAKTKSTRILLAEDNIVNQRVAQKQLARLGYSADVVSSGVQVLEAVARQRYDVILMDCQMPEMDGYEATKRIRQLPNSLGQVRIIAMTANAMHGDREKCIAAGMDDYVAKPVKIDDLRAALERCRNSANAETASVPVNQI